MIKNIGLTIVSCVLTVLLVLSFSISLPIYFRPFYYWHIEPLGIEETTKRDKATIIEAYDEVLDYLTLPNRTFSTGDFKHTKSAANHFEDCKALFTLNTSVLIGSACGVLVLFLLRRRKIFQPVKVLKMHHSCLCGGCVLLLVLVISGFVLFDFDGTFTLFHQLFFPNKDNWKLNIKKDPIINAFPPEFFRNAALLIFTSILLLSIGLIWYGWHQRNVTNCEAQAKKG